MNMAAFFPLHLSKSNSIIILNINMAVSPTSNYGDANHLYNTRNFETVKLLLY